MEASSGFVWRDGPRTVIFAVGTIERAPQLLRDNGFEPYDLLTTHRAIADAPELKEGAAQVHDVPRGGVPEAAGALIGGMATRELVAFGGGRVIDVAKAIASVRGGRVATIATTLAGSPMTSIHRLPAGRESEALGMVRPELVIADPQVMTSAEEVQLRATAMNALAHGAESLYTPYANPVSELSALRGIELIAAALDRDRGLRDPSDLALGAVLCAAAVDSAGIAFHHATCQTLVRVLDLPHAEVNAAMLPHTMASMTHRAPRQIAAFAGALGTSAGGVGARLSELRGYPLRLSDLGADHLRIDAVLDEIEARGDARANTPNPPDREDLRQMIEAAW